MEGSGSRASSKSPFSHNSVHRTILLATSKLVRFHFGNHERDRIFADVTWARVNDTRDVWLSPDQIRSLLDSSDYWFRPFVITALTTSADRLPLMRMKCRDVKIAHDQGTDLYSGIIYLPDSKTDHRPRSVAIVDAVCREILPLLKDKTPDDHVFNGPPDGERMMQGLRP